MTKKRVLFVDDDSFLLAGLRRLLRNCRDEWQMEFADSGNDALRRMQADPFDVVVSDMRMPGMDGEQLLQQVHQIYPDAVRIILSGQSEQEAVFRVIGPAHKYLSKPCKVEQLKQTIDSAFNVRSHLSQPAVTSLTDAIDLPTEFREQSSELLQLVQSHESSCGQIAAALMNAACVQQVFWKIATPPGTPPPAPDDVAAVAKSLGLNRLRPALLSACVLSQFDGDIAGHAADTWQVAAAARRIAECEADQKEVIDHAEIAALLHTVGLLALRQFHPERHAATIARAQSSGRPLWQAEYDLLQTTHAEIGGWILMKWGLPSPVIEAVALRYQPRISATRDITPLAVLHAAIALVTDCDPDSAFLEECGAAERLELWRSSVADFCCAAFSD